MIMSDIVSWVTSHPAEIGGAWAVASAIFNVAVRFKSLEDWIVFGEAYPFTAAAIRTVRALGVDPVKFLGAIATALETHANKVSKQ